MILFLVRSRQHYHNLPSFRLFHVSCTSSSEPDSVLYASLLRKCGSLLEGRRVHLDLVQGGHDKGTFLGNMIVQMYGSCGSMEDARAVFSKIAQRNVFSWNILVVAHAQNGHLQEASSLFDKMSQRNIVSWNAMIAAYAQNGDVDHAKGLFDGMPGKDVVSWTAMIASYAQNGYLQAARNMFDRMPEKNVISWNAMITAYAQDGHGEEALQLFRSMHLDGLQPNKVTFISTLDACAILAALAAGRLVHANIVEIGLNRDTEVGTAVVNMYGKCNMLEAGISAFSEILRQDTISSTAMFGAFAQNGQLDEAMSIFETIPHRDVVSWNAMIAGYAQNGHPKEALGLFRLMDLEGMQVDKVTCIVALDACGSLGAIKEGKAIHADISQEEFMSNVVLGTALVNMYGKCGALEDARSVFDIIPSKNVVSWNAMIAAYTQNGHLEEAKSMFNEMPVRDVASWNSMIAASAQAGQGRGALSLFRLMDLEGVQPDRISLIATLDACASLPDLAQGKMIHAEILDNKLLSDVVVGTALLNMYGKCGSLDDAGKVFDRIKCRNVVSWNAMITAYSQNGRGKHAVELFWTMGLEGMQPDEITFVHSFSACSHSGLMNNGYSFFASMTGDFGISPSQEHYACMIDHLGRNGRIAEAEDLLNNMPFEPDFVACTALLGACGIHGDLGRGKRAAKRAFELDPNNAETNAKQQHIRSIIVHMEQTPPRPVSEDVLQHMLLGPSHHRLCMH